MNVPDILFPIAAIGTLQTLMQMFPLGLLAVYSLTLEITLNKYDRTFSAGWWFFCAIAILALSDVIWKSWTASTPMADILLYGEAAGQLTLSIAAFLAIVGALLLWLLISGIRLIVIEAHGSGWAWAFLRLSPLFPFFWFVFQTLVKGNARVGPSGLISLINL